MLVRLRVGNKNLHQFTSSNKSFSTKSALQWKKSKLYNLIPTTHTFAHNWAISHTLTITVPQCVLFGHLRLYTNLFGQGTSSMQRFSLNAQIIECLNQQQLSTRPYKGWIWPLYATNHPGVTHLLLKSSNFLKRDVQCVFLWFLWIIYTSTRIEDQALGQRIY